MKHPLLNDYIDESFILDGETYLRVVGYKCVMYDKIKRDGTVCYITGEEYDRANQLYLSHAEPSRTGQATNPLAPAHEEIPHPRDARSVDHPTGDVRP